MSGRLKVAIGIVGALVAGFAAGYLLGVLGREPLQERVAVAERQASNARESLTRVTAECEQQAKKARGSRLLLQAKEHLLRAEIELLSNNYGLASQQLGAARSRLRSARKEMPKEQQKRLAALFEQIANVQTLVMRLDPMARTQLQDLLRELQRIPGAR